MKPDERREPKLPANDPQRADKTRHERHLRSVLRQVRLDLRVGVGFAGRVVETNMRYFQTLLTLLLIACTSSCGAPYVYSLTWDENNPAEDKARLMIAMDHWNACGSAYVQLVPAEGVPVSWTDRPIPGHEDKSAETLASNWGGLDGHIGSGTHIVYQTVGEGDDNLNRQVFEHELGHLFGLPHRGDPTKLMYGMSIAKEAHVEEFPDCYYLRKIHNSAL